MVGSEFEPRGNYDAVDFVDADLSGSSADGSRFLECRIVKCTMDDAVLDNCRFIDSIVDSSTATTLYARTSTWRDTKLEGCRIGAFIAHDANLTRLDVKDCKLEYVNLRATDLRDVTFRDCSVGELDLSGTTAHQLRFPGSTIETVRLADTTFSEVDFSDASLSQIQGITGLRGASISEPQLHDLAPAFAEHLGVVVV